MTRLAIVAKQSPCQAVRLVIYTYALHAKPSFMQSKTTLAIPSAVRGVGSHLGAPPVAREPLLPRQEGRAQPPLPREGGGAHLQPVGAAAHDARSFPWLPVAGFGYLTISSGIALRRSWGDPGAASFVVSAYGDLLLLFYCLRRCERAEPGSALREWLKLAVWLLTSALTLLFSYKVVAVMPAAVAAIVWVMGLAIICGGFVAFFCFEENVRVA